MTKFGIPIASKVIQIKARANDGNAAAKSSKIIAGQLCGFLAIIAAKDSSSIIFCNMLRPLMKPRWYTNAHWSNFASNDNAIYFANILASAFAPLSGLVFFNSHTKSSGQPLGRIQRKAMLNRGGHVPEHNQNKTG